MSQQRYDCIVIGGGPSGSTTAALVAERGHRVLVIEKARFPRFHIGESLIPETYWPLKRLGMLDKMKSSCFVKKYSVQFVSASGRESAPFYFDEVNPHESSQTWQVLRSEFDHMLLKNAEEHGAEVWQETTVDEVLFDKPVRRNGDGADDAAEPRAVGVRVRRGGGEPMDLAARVIVDATGANALLQKRLGLRRGDNMLRKAAVFGHYKGARREPGRDEGATLVLNIQNQDGWFWYIPLHDDTVSIGAVADIDYLIKGRGTPEQILEEEIQRCPAILPRLATAKRASPVHVINDYSYGATRCAGDGWVLVGDAFTFLDPMYSSGVFFALKSGEIASDAIHDALIANDTSAERLGRWGGPFYEGVQAMRRLVYAFYAKGFSFGAFLRDHPQFKKNITQLLTGDVFRDEPQEVFEPMSKQIKLPEPMTLTA